MAAEIQISEFETVEESAEVFASKDQGVQVDSDSVSQPKLGRQNQTSPDLHHPSVLPTNRAGEVTSPKVRPGSDPSELEPGPSGDAGGFRVRSKSAPPVMWAAMRYGRELRRMSDEFDMTFQGLPRPKSASHANELKKADGWTEFFRGMFGPSRRKDDRDKNKKF